MTTDNASQANALSDEQVNAICKSLTATQAKVLVEAYNFTVSTNKVAGTSAMHWYHRGKFGFGISRRTAQALFDKSLAQQSVWEQWFYDTQFIKLTSHGYAVAASLAAKQKEKAHKV